MIKLQNGGALRSWSRQLRDLQCKQSRWKNWAETVCVYANRFGRAFVSAQTHSKILQGLLEIEIYTQKKKERKLTARFEVTDKVAVLTEVPALSTWTFFGGQVLRARTCGCWGETRIDLQKTWWMCAAAISLGVCAFATVFLGRRTALFLESLCWALLRDDTVRVVVKVFGVMGVGLVRSWVVG